MGKDNLKGTASAVPKTDSTNVKSIDKEQEKYTEFVDEGVTSQKRAEEVKSYDTLVEKGTKNNKARVEAQSEKQAINTTVKSRADSQEVKVNTDIKAENTKLTKEMPNLNNEAEKALQKAEEKTAFKGLKKVGAYAAGALALAGLTSALISSKGQQTNNQLYGQQPLY